MSVEQPSCCLSSILSSGLYLRGFLHCRAKRLNLGFAKTCVRATFLWQDQKMEPTIPLLGSRSQHNWKGEGGSYALRDHVVKWEAACALWLLLWAVSSGHGWRRGPYNLALLTASPALRPQVREPAVECPPPSNSRICG